MDRDLTLGAGKVALERETGRVLKAREAHLANAPMPRIVDAIDGAVARWLDPGHALRRQAEDELPGVTGYSPEMVREGLPLLLRPFRREGLLELLRSEFGGALEPSAESEGGRSRIPRAPRLITHILSGNIPAVGPETMIRALLLRSTSLVKTSSADPLFPRLFAQSLAEADPAIGESIAVMTWKGGGQEMERQAFAASDAVVLYGSDEAIAALRILAPPGIPCVEHGSRISFAAIGREALTPRGLRDLARQTAWDISFFDQQGCVSPHAIFVEAGGECSPLEFAQALAIEMAALEARLPRGRLSPGAAGAIQQVRSAWEMRQAAGQSVALLASEGSTAWTVLYEEGGVLAPTCLNRVVRVIGLAALEELPPTIGTLGRWLQTAGVAVAPQRLGELAMALSAAGVTRICPIGQMQHPPASWLHDGRHPLRDLVLWTETEAPTPPGGQAPR